MHDVDRWPQGKKQMEASARAVLVLVAVVAVHSLAFPAGGARAPASFLRAFTLGLPDVEAYTPSC